jgi:hypothetical protein
MRDRERERERDGTIGWALQRYAWSSVLLGWGPWGVASGLHLGKFSRSFVALLRTCHNMCCGTHSDFVKKAFSHGYVG